jgi:hypothetical protein
LTRIRAYGLANDATTYARDFHDITSGNNSFAAGAGWDEVTGWGSADFDKLFNNHADIAYTGPHQAHQGDSITLSATLLDQGASTPVVGRTVFIAAGADSCSGVTDSSGHVSCGITVSTAPGHYNVIAAFDGDAAYVAASVTESFTVLDIPTTITYTGPTSGEYHDSVTLTARLNDDSAPGSLTRGDPISGETVHFTLGAVSCSGVTNGSGVASCPVTPTDVPGGYSVAVSFAGDAVYHSSNTNAAFTLNKEETTLTYTGPKVILSGTSVATLTATLVEDGANDNDGDGGSPGPVPTETVTLSLGSQSCTGTTDPVGNVTCTLTSVSVALGPETVGAAFAGDAYYLGATDSTTAIVFAFPSTGAFTLGDLTVAAAPPTVTWWSNNWYLADNLSGGFAPPSFKGFASSVTLPNTTPANVCSSSWTTTGGNSPPPPATVPSYMGVIVASTITKTGNIIKSIYAQIVVVKTDPGYAPGPDNLGTGEIVASFCP